MADMTDGRAALKAILLIMDMVVVVIELKIEDFFCLVGRERKRIGFFDWPVQTSFFGCILKMYTPRI